jgi:hypothetical protein
LPLISKAKNKNLFDGWPTIHCVFRLARYVRNIEAVAVENSLVIMKKFRVLYCPDPNEDPWPKQLSIDLSTNCIAKHRTVWFEIYVHLTVPTRLL